MRFRSCLLLMFLLVVPVIAVNAAMDTADEIVKEIDKHRLLFDNFEMMVRIDSYKNKNFENTTIIKGRIYNEKNAILTFLEPVKMRERKIEIKDNDVWLIMPNVKNPVRLSPSQRLVGGISYSDIIATSYYELYTAKLVGEESIAGINADGTDAAKTFNCYKLELNLKSKGNTYSKIVIWADKQTLSPIKADFYSLSGKKMTTAHYLESKKLYGKFVITKLILFNHLSSEQYCVIEYSDIKLFQ